MLRCHVRNHSQEAVMKIAPRLARPAAVAALTAAALALPAAPAGAMTKQECLQARFNAAMGNLQTAGEQQYAADYWTWFNYTIYALGYLRFCAEGR
jgi:hypothetical protein